MLKIVRTYRDRMMDLLRRKLVRLLNRGRPQLPNERKSDPRSVTVGLQLLILRI